MSAEVLERGKGPGAATARREAPRGEGPGADALLAHVRTALGDLGLDPARVTPASRLVDDLELDSLDWVDLAQRLEEALPVRIREERLASLPTVAEVVALLRARLDAAGRRGGEPR